MMGSGQAHKNEAGFTLLELIVSIALVVLITTYLFSSFSFGRRAWEASAEVEKVASADIARDYIRTRLSQAAKLLQQDIGKGETVVFDGRADRLRFVADVADLLRAGGLYAVTVSMEGSSIAELEGGRVLLSEGLFRRKIAGQDLPKPYTSDLMQGVASLRFRYYGNPTFKDEAERWHEEWIDAVRLPRLVSVRITFDAKAGDRRQWPELLVGLKMADHGDRRLGG